MTYRYRIVLDAPDTDPIVEEGEARDPLRDVRRLLDAFLTRQAPPGGGLSTSAPPAFTRLAIELIASEPE